MPCSIRTPCTKESSSLGARRRAEGVLGRTKLPEICSDAANYRKHDVIHKTRSTRRITGSQRQQRRAEPRDRKIGKGIKVLPNLLLSVGPGADPGVHAVIQSVTLSHLPGVSCHYFPPGLHLPGRYQIILFGDRDICV